MTPEQRKAVERLTRGIDNGTYGSGYPICKGCGRVWFDDDPVPRDGHGRDCPVPTLLALVREPVASVEGTVRCSALSRSDNWIESERRYVQITLPPEYVGQRVRIDVHAVDAGEEK